MIDKSLTGQLMWLQQGLIISLTIFASTPVHAQITPDNTLGSESSRIVPNTLINNASADLIEGGATRGTNLFHSFSQFNIGDGQRVYFGNPSGVENIFTRVTSGSASNILGTLGVNGVANLFLMNPNGILFGKNASLDVRGSFVGTTANAIQFGNQGVFSATNPQSIPLLTINPSALLFTQVQANAGITNLSQAPAGVNLVGVDVTGLRVPDGKSLLFVGGDINIDGGSLRAYNGNIELVGFSAPGRVQLNTVNNTFSLSVPSDIQRSNIFLTNGAEVNVRGSDAGSITINAQNLNLAEGSKLRAGIDTGLGTPQSQAGDITVNATGATTLSDSSFIANVPQPNSVGQGGNINVTTGLLTLKDSNLNGNTFGNGSAANIFVKAGDIFLNNGGIVNNVQTGAVGNAGNIQISTNSLKVANGAFISSDIFGKGDGGNITINARDSISSDGNSEISTTVLGQAMTKGGDIQITTGSLSLTNGARINTVVLGQGNAGDIIVNARDTIKLDGVDVIYNAPGGIQSDLLGGVGKSGNIQIATGSLLVTNGAGVSSGTSGRGDAGNITINARDKVAIEGFGGSMAIKSFVTSTAGDGSIGNAGNIRITTGELLLKDGGGIQAFTGGQGKGGNINLDVGNTTTFDGSSGASTFVIGSKADAGNIELKTGSLFLTNGGQMSTAIGGAGGNAGKITIVAREIISIDGAISGLKSRLLSGEGRGGDIEITTGSLSLTNGAELSSDTNARGNAGNITINARDTITVDGTSGKSSSSASSVSGSNAVGNGGDIRINAKTLFLTNGGAISTFSAGQGNAGNIFLDTSNRINIDGVGSDRRPSRAVSFLATRGIGRGGNIEITTPSLSVTNGAILLSSTFGRGNGGDIIIDTRDTVKFDNAKAYSTVESTGFGNAGNIKLNTGSLSLLNGGFLSAITNGQGNAGDIAINVRDTVKIDGVNGNQISGIVSAVTTQAIGKGGNIAVQSEKLSLSKGALISSSSAGQGNAGDININSGAVRLDESEIEAVTNSSDGGNINLKAADFLLLRRGSGISTTAGFASSSGNGGNISIDTPFIVAVPREDSDITANAFTGNGGKVNINVQSIFGIKPRSQASPNSSDITASSQYGVQGQVSIKQPEVQPTQAILELPAQIVDASNQIGQLCPRGELAFRRPLSKFIVTGRGNLPPSPLQPMPGKTGTRQLATLDNSPTRIRAQSLVPLLPTPSSPIIEAQGFAKNANGEIFLVAQAPSSTPSAATTTAACVK